MNLEDQNEAFSEFPSLKVIFFSDTDLAREAWYVKLPEKIR